MFRDHEFPPHPPHPNCRCAPLKLFTQRELSMARTLVAVRNGHIVYRIVDGVNYEVGATESRPYLIKGDVIYPWVW